MTIAFSAPMATTGDSVAPASYTLTTAGADTPTAAVAAVYSVTLTGKLQADVSGKAIDGVTIAWNTDLATTMGDFVTSYNTATGKSYTAAWVAADSKLTLTAKTAGAVATDPTTDITGVTVDEDVAGANAGVTPGSPVTADATKFSVTGTNSVTVTFGGTIKEGNIVTVVGS